MNSKAGRALMSVAVATLLFGALPALAGDSQGDNAQGQQGQDGGRSRNVPEFDPTTVGAIAALLVGCGALLARRRR